MADSDRWETNAAFFSEPRAGHVAVWTGAEMTVFGGRDGENLHPNDTVRYRLTAPLYLYAK